MSEEETKYYKARTGSRRLPPMKGLQRPATSID